MLELRTGEPGATTEAAQEAQEMGKRVRRFDTESHGMVPTESVPHVFSLTI